MPVQQVEKGIEIIGRADDCPPETPTIRWRFLTPGIVPDLVDISCTNIETGEAFVFKDIAGEKFEYTISSPLPAGAYAIWIRTVRPLKLRSDALRIGVESRQGQEAQLDKNKGQVPRQKKHAKPKALSPRESLSASVAPLLCFEWQLKVADVLSFIIHVANRKTGKVLKSWSGIPHTERSLKVEVSELFEFFDQDLLWYVNARYFNQDVLSDKLPLHIVSPFSEKSLLGDDSTAEGELLTLDNVGIKFIKTSRIEKNEEKGRLGRLFAKYFQRQEFWALQEISFSLRKGDVLGVIGSNGAGKSTLLKILTGVLYPDTGSLVSNGRVSALLSLGAGFMHDLSGRENVYLNGAYLGLTKKETNALFDQIVEFSELGPFIDTQIRYYSSGMKARLGFSVAVHLDPEILIVDEVLAAGDKDFRKKAEKKMKSFMLKAKGLIIASHSLPFIRGITNKCLLLDKGRIKAFGPTEEVLKLY